MSIDQMLNELRKSRGLSQQALCEKLNLSRGTYSLWETGKRRPELDSLIRLADFYGVSVDYILGREGVTAAASKVGDPMADLPDDARQSVEDFIEFVRKRNKKKK
jgi:transcriptional regulator with XRE-family HTH domain